MPRSDRRLSTDLMGSDRLLTTDEVAELFVVDPGTVARWATAGRFPDAPSGEPGVIRTAGGHIRIRQSVVRGLLNGTLHVRGDDDVEQE